MINSSKACPPGPLMQSSLNTSTQDKFILVLNLPEVLRRKAKTNPLFDIDNLQMSVFGTVVPQISVPPIETRMRGQSVKFSSIARPEYAPLSVSFVVDNEYKNYFLLWSWLNVYNDSSSSMYNGMDVSEASLETEYQTTFSLLGLNEYNKTGIEFIFSNAFITSLGAITYNYKASELIECNAEFTFNQLTIKK